MPLDEASSTGCPQRAHGHVWALRVAHLRRGPGYWTHEHIARVRHLAPSVRTGSRWPGHQKIRAATPASHANRIFAATPEPHRAVSAGTISRRVRQIC